MRRLLEILAIVLIVGIAWNYGGRNESDSVYLDTVRVTVWDTVRVRIPEEIKSVDLGVRSYRVKLLGRVETEYAEKGIKGDNAVEADSVEVELPITQKVYEDSTYRAWVSGYDARLDSFVLYRPTRFVTVTVKEPASLFSWGLQAGLGMTPKGIQPYIGIGGQLRF